MQPSDYRLERDSVGELQVPKDAYYGVHTLRAVQNFPITGTRVHPAMVESAAQVKKASALANLKAGTLPKAIADAIVKACDDVIAGQLHDAFLVDPIQGGAGTSMNMNANEVIANRAIEYLGGQRGDYSLVHPNDHVNFGQSTNDVFPTMGKLTALKLFDRAQEALKKLRAALLQKAEEFGGVLKMGRTQMQDAVPVLLGQEFHAYATAIGRDIRRIDLAKEELYAVNMGGTAIGTGINASPVYCDIIADELAAVTGYPFRRADDLVDATQHVDCYVFCSGILKSAAVNISKMCNDLRLMSSGPRTGLGEIFLPDRQNGSSIMPGKVNPVIPEVASQVAFNIMGNDVTVAIAAEGGQLELNAFEPIIFFKLFQSLTTLAAAAHTLTDNCVVGITANRDRCQSLVEGSVGIITALTPYVGYQAAADIAKKAIKTGAPVRRLVLEAGLLTEKELSIVLDPAAMTRPGIPGLEEMEKLGKGLMG